MLIGHFECLNLGCNGNKVQSTLKIQTLCSCFLNTLIHKRNQHLCLSFLVALCIVINCYYINMTRTEKKVRVKNKMQKKVTNANV